MKAARTKQHFINREQSSKELSTLHQKLWDQNNILKILKEKKNERTVHQDFCNSENNLQELR